MEFFALLLTVQVLFMLYQLIDSKNLKSSIRKAQSKSLFMAQKNEILLHCMNLSIENLTKTRVFPPSLANLAFADEMDVVLSVKKIKVGSVSAPYNASIGHVESGYVLFFRYDTPSFGRDPIFSNIGCVSLDQNFAPLNDSFFKIETQSLFSEDARFFQNEGRYFLVYNDLIPRFERTLRIGAIDLTKKRLDYITVLRSFSKKMEKNWTPFSYRGEIKFLYTIHPQKILSLPNPRKNHLETFGDSLSSSLEWPHKWGALRGGTPALLVDGEYLSFFHSSFEDNKGILWYVMGAYTFAASSPFKITRISPHPILFKGIYDTIHEGTANPRVRSLYPAGFICEEREGKDLISVSCGENDSGIKIITMDKKALLASLKIVN